MMKHYEKLLAKGSFSREQLIEIVGTATAANQVIYEYQKKGLIEKVKRDFYVVISMETKQPVLSRYQIGSNLDRKSTRLNSSHRSQSRMPSSA